MGAVEGPRREAQDVLLLPLHFAHGPVLPLQLLLLPLGHALAGTGRGHRCHQAGACRDEAGDGPGLTWASLTSTLPRLLSSFMICRMAIFTSTCTRFCTFVTRRMLPGTGGQGDMGDTHKPRSSLVERCSTACLSPRRCTSAASTERCFRTASSRNWDLGNGGEWGKMGGKRGKGGKMKKGEEKKGRKEEKGTGKGGQKGGEKKKGKKRRKEKKRKKRGK